MKSYDVVKVIWRDIVSDNDWKETADIMSAVVVSVGFKICETEHDLIICNGVSNDEGFFNLIAIPLGVIFKVEKMEVGE